jgi:hypothetical protein
MQAVAADRPTLWKCRVISILGEAKEGDNLLRGRGEQRYMLPTGAHTLLARFSAAVQPTEHWNSITRRDFLSPRSSPSSGSCPVLTNGTAHPASALACLAACCVQAHVPSPSTAVRPVLVPVCCPSFA